MSPSRCRKPHEALWIYHVTISLWSKNCPHVTILCDHLYKDGACRDKGSRITDPILVVIKAITLTWETYGLKLEPRIIGTLIWHTSRKGKLSNHHKHMEKMEPIEPFSHQSADYEIQSDQNQKIWEIWELTFSKDINSCIERSKNREFPLKLGN